MNEKLNFVNYFICFDPLHIYFVVELKLIVANCSTNLMTHQYLMFVIILHFSMALI